jgi:predicted transcriptional regulator
MDKKIAGLLEDIKRLMVLDLVDRGLQGKRIAEVLDVDPAIVSRMVAPRKAKKKK